MYPKNPKHFKKKYINYILHNTQFSLWHYLCNIKSNVSPNAYYSNA